MKYKTSIPCLCALLILNTIAKSQMGIHQRRPSQDTLHPMLPTPSGPYSIGRQAFDLTDTTRIDQFSADPAKHRELMVYVWYPTRHSVRQLGGDTCQVR